MTNVWDMKYPFPRRRHDRPASTAAKESRHPSFRSHPAGPPPSPERLRALLESHGVRLTDRVREQLWRYHQLLRKHNGDRDLTRLIGFETMVQRHYADCLILDRYLHGRWPSPLVDIGSGAGFPGLMIKLIAPETEIILAEPRPRRADFLALAIRELGLTKISVFGHKFTSRSFTQPVRGAITRAFEPLGKTLPRLSHALEIGGTAMFMKGPGAAEELREPLPPEYRLLRREAYRIPATTLDRELLIFERLPAPSAEPRTTNPAD